MKALSDLLLGLVAGFVIAFSASNCAAQNQKACTTPEEKQALDEADTLKDWESIHRSFIHYAQCDDGAIAEGYSDSIGRLLSRDWKDLRALAKLGATDKKFEGFVLRHIDETLSSDVLKTIASNAEQSCPADQTTLCKKISLSARAASAK